MGLTLSHTSALDALRRVRSHGVDVRHEVDSVPLARPHSWTGKRWSKRAFSPEEWQWRVPSASDELHVMVAQATDRIRVRNIVSHLAPKSLPPDSVLWLDEHASMACPALMYVQLAEVFALPALVLVGYELCGTFSRSADDPIDGPPTLWVPPATSVAELRGYLDQCKGVRGVGIARKALDYVCDGAASVPEAVLATIYALPQNEGGYGMGPVRINERVTLSQDVGATKRHRFPDLMFSFAPVGINYDGEDDHLDLGGLVRAATDAALADAKDAPDAILALGEKKDAVRAKAVDDIRRNRELAAQGRLVLPLTKEDLYGFRNLDAFTLQLLACAHAFFGVDTSAYERSVNDTSLSRDRYAVLASMLYSGRSGGQSRGRF